MTADQFRRLALSFPQAIESAHMRHPDFRVRGGKIFATLGYPDRTWAMVKLTPEQQEEFVSFAPDVFVPVKGGWAVMAPRACALSRPTRTASAPQSPPHGATQRRRSSRENSSQPLSEYGKREEKWQSDRFW